MNIKIGARIRNLRVQANITQEKLSNHLGVSVQAVSRWESEICYPDLELIPAIAKYFGVTTDYILCTEQETIQPLENKLKEEWRIAFYGGYTQKALDIINEALLAMPNNYEFIFMKAETLACFYLHSCHLTRITEGDKLLRSIFELINIINGECKIEAIRCKAMTLKLMLDTKLNNHNSFLKAVESLPDIENTKSNVLSEFYCWDKEKRLSFCKEHILKLMLSFSKTALRMAECDEVSKDEKIEIISNSISIIHLITGNNLCGEFEVYLEKFYNLLFELTGDCVYKSEIGTHIKKYDGLCDDWKYESAFLKGIKVTKQKRNSYY